MTVLEILRAITGAPDPNAKAVAWAWRALSEHIDRRYRLPPREHADVRQRTLLKVWKGAAGIEADSAGRAEAWLRRVHMSARIEHHRAVGTRMMDAALRSTPADGDLGFVERALAHDGDGDDVLVRPDADEKLEQALGEVLDRVSVWLEENVSIARKRQGDYRRAECALLANVRGLDASAIVAMLGIDPPPAKDVIYKWIERGREQVLIPALDGWDHPIAGTLRDQLIASRRADAGKPRESRRGSVSRLGEGASSGKRSPHDE
jgi:DNA-directed RNA polymerase specialized sigma24 family protein